MPHIIPIRDLKNTTEISRMCSESAEPIYITKNGYGDMVIMSMDTYEKKIVLRALMDITLGVAACSVSESKFNSGKCSPIKVIIEEA